MLFLANLNVEITTEALTFSVTVQCRPLCAYVFYMILIPLVRSRNYVGCEVFNSFHHECDDVVCPFPVARPEVVVDDI